jgi:hypothetical protein
MAMPAGVAKKILSIHVVVDVMTKDKLRKFSFGLDKSSDANDVDVWVVHFKLFERDDKKIAFAEPSVNIDVELKTKNFPKAELTAAKGFNQAQTERTLVQVATASDKFTAGKAEESKVAKAVESVIEARDAA